MTKNNTIVPNCFYRISIKALIRDEQKRFALSLEKNGLWDLPGGGLDFGESPKEALIREIKEETGLKVTEMAPNPTYVVPAPHRKVPLWVCNLIYDTKVKNLNITPSDECVKLKFFTKKEALKEKLYVNVIEFLKMYKE